MSRCMNQEQQLPTLITILILILANQNWRTKELNNSAVTNPEVSAPPL
jgi:uncharacterized integral membrane protein